MDEAINALKKGIGVALSLPVLILGSGAMLGRIITDIGAAQRIALPLVSDPSVSPELVLTIGSGSLILSHVNDSGFWLFEEYFNLSIKETLSIWTVMETYNHWGTKD